jgi:hypothetical protein
MDWHRMSNPDIDSLFQKVLQSDQQDVPGRYFLFVLPTHHEVPSRLTVGAGRAAWVVAAPQLLQAPGRLEQALRGQASAVIAATFARLAGGSTLTVITTHAVQVQMCGSWSSSCTTV